MEKNLQNNNETNKYGYFLYKPDKPLHSMTIKELVNHSKICKSLDKTSYSKIQRMEKWDSETLRKKKEAFLNKQKNKKTRKKNMLKKLTKKRNRIKNRKSRIKKKIKKILHKKTKKTEII